MISAKHQALHEALRHAQANHWAEARGALEQVLSQPPHDAGVHLGAATIFQILGDEGRAIAHYKASLAQDERIAIAHTGLALLLLHGGHSDLALTHAARAADLAPDDPNALLVHAKILSQTGASELAEAKATSLAARLTADDPSLSEVADILARSGANSKAIALLRRSIDAAPSQAVFLTLARLLEVAGQLTDAFDVLNNAMTVFPNSAEIGSRRLSIMRLMPEFDAAILAQEAKSWAMRHADPLTARASRHTNTPEPNRPLRVGYLLAATMRHNTLSYTTLPLLRAHDRSEVHPFAFSDLIPTDEDDVSEQFRHACTVRQTAHLNDDALAEQIRRDAIDILVDPYGHPPGSRLLALARKPAPLCVQILHLGPAQMAALDASLADDILAPADLRKLYEETVSLLPSSFLFTPLRDVPETVVKKPLEAAGELVLASFNQHSKINSVTLGAWARILQQLPNAHILLKGHGLDSPATREQTVARLATLGVSGTRIRFAPYSRSYLEHMQTYNTVDIALDTWPYGSIITACEALWMGVPLVAWMSDRPIGRYAGAFLQQLGEHDLIAETENEYVEKVVRLAGQVSRRQALRQSLRQRFSLSRLGDASRFARSLEAEFRRLWIDWCERTAV